MSTHTYPFAILRARPSALRGESMNVGIVVFVDGGLMARIDANPARLRAFDPDLAALPIWDSLQNDIERLAETTQAMHAQHHLLKTMLSPVRADEQLGEIALDDGEEIESRIDYLMHRLVARTVRTIPIPKQVKVPKQSKLNTQLRQWFRSSKLYSRNVADLSKHRVVPNYPVAANNDLYAEFALMNGVVHVIETLDFRGHDKMSATVHKEAAIKSIVLDQAKRHLDPGSQKIAVVAASDYGAMRPAIGIVSNYADDVITMASSSDRQRLADFIASALHQQSIPLLAN